MTENSFRLSNGAAVLAAQNEGLHSVSLAVVLPFCAHETAGVYHFVEHLFFERAGELRAEEINRRMSECGSEILAYTAKNHMCFSFHCRREVFAQQLSLLVSMLREKGHAAEDFDKVLPVIENEIFEYDFYDYAREDVLRELWYDARYRESVLGTPKALRSLTLETLQKARDGLFTDAMHIFLAGGFSETELSLVKEAFESFSLSPFSPLPPVSAPPLFERRGKSGARARSANDVHLSRQGRFRRGDFSRALSEKRRVLRHGRGVQRVYDRRGISLLLGGRRLRGFGRRTYFLLAGTREKTGRERLQRSRAGFRTLGAQSAADERGAPLFRG